MSDVSKPTVELNVGDIISDGVSLGMKNFVNLLVTGILFGLTFWIPYLNIGTYIAMQDLVPKMSRGEQIQPASIFDEKYRRNFGEFFLLFAFFQAGMLAGLIFVYVGAIVVGIAWSLAMPLFVDKNTGPIQSLRLSNKLTYGHKTTMFLAYLVFGIIIAILIGIFAGAIGGFIGMLLTFIVYVLALPMILGMAAHVYGKLTAGLTEADIKAATG